MALDGRSGGKGSSPGDHECLTPKFDPRVALEEKSWSHQNVKWSSSVKWELDQNISCHPSTVGPQITNCWTDKRIFKKFFLLGLTAVLHRVHSANEDIKENSEAVKHSSTAPETKSKGFRFSISCPLIISIITMNHFSSTHYPLSITVYFILL